MPLKCFHCNIESRKEFNMDLTNRCKNTYEFCSKDINNCILLLRKGVFSYEYMDSWERLDETKLPSIYKFYSNLKPENITDSDYRHANRLFKKSELRSMDEYHDLYVNSDTLLPSDVFENFKNKCIQIYELDPAHLLPAPGLAWQSSLKKTGIKLELITDVDMSLLVENGIRGGICHAIYRYAKAKNKYMKNYDKNKESSYIEYLDANNLYGWAMCHKLLVDGFKWKQNMLKI